MKFDDLDAFVENLRSRGYRRERNQQVVKPADQQYWLGIGMNGEERSYTVEVSIYDWHPFRANHTFTHRYSAALKMRLNHRTMVDVEGLVISMQHDDLTVSQFEMRCNELYKAMVKLWPRKTPVEA